MMRRRRVNPALIGAFVLGAVVLAIAGVVLLGSGRLFHRNYPFVLYFPGSVNGLRVGAPVKFRGVEIGSVQDIRLQLKHDQSVFRIPVIIGIDPDKITSLGGSETILNSPAEYRSAIEAGLRGQLQTESFVTGVLFVALEYFPGSPSVQVQQPVTRKFRYREIPTEPSSTEKARMAVTEVLTKLAASDLEGLVDSARQAISEVHQLVSSPDLMLTIRAVGNVAGRLGDAAGNVSQMATGIDSNVSRLTADLHQTSVKAGAVMDQAGQVLQHTDATLNDGPVVDELTRTLHEVSAAARSVRLLTGYMERNPSAVLFGKPVARKK